MSPPTNICRQRRTEHRFYADIVTDITVCSTIHWNNLHQVLSKSRIGIPNNKQMLF